MISHLLQSVITFSSTITILFLRAEVLPYVLRSQTFLYLERYGKIFNLKIIMYSETCFLFLCFRIWLISQSIIPMHFTLFLCWLHEKFYKYENKKHMGVNLHWLLHVCFGHHFWILQVIHIFGLVLSFAELYNSHFCTEKLHINSTYMGSGQEKPNSII